MLNLKKIWILIILFSLTGCATLEKTNGKIIELETAIIDDVKVNDNGSVDLILTPQFELFRRIGEHYLFKGD